MKDAFSWPLYYREFIKNKIEIFRKHIIVDKTTEEKKIQLI